MCGRYTYLFKWKQLHRLMRLHEIPLEELFSRYNVAPSQRAPIIRLDSTGNRVGVMMQWGLVLPWMSQTGKGASPTNARGESIFLKPTFRKAARERRCLVPVSGFYEWQKNEGEKRKQPFWIGREDREPLCFGGLWESWHDGFTPNSPALETFAIVTTSPNALMVPIHDRMPVIVSESDWTAWLDPNTTQTEVERLIRPFAGNGLTAYPVSTAVNSPRRDDSTLIERVAPQEKPPNLFS